MAGVVLLVGKSLAHLGHVRALLSAGSVVVLAPTAEVARRWLNEAMETRRRGRADALIRVDDLEIDTRAHRVCWRGRPMRVTELELQVLTALAEEAGRAWSFGELLTRAWGTADTGDTELVRSAVKRLRRKLASAGVTVEIESVWGLGYRLGVPSA
jgi:two-component system, OmpR family, response regulator MtrA